MTVHKPTDEQWLFASEFETPMTREERAALIVERDARLIEHGLGLPPNVVERLDDYCRRVGRGRIAVVVDALMAVLIQDLRDENATLRASVAEHESRLGVPAKNTGPAVRNPTHEEMAAKSKL